MCKWILFGRLELCSGLLVDLHLRQYHIKRMRNMPQPMFHLSGGQLNLREMHKLHGRIPVHARKMRLQLSPHSLQHFPKRNQSVRRLWQFLFRMLHLRCHMFWMCQWVLTLLYLLQPNDILLTRLFDRYKKCVLFMSVSLWNLRFGIDKLHELLERVIVSVSVHDCLSQWILHRSLNNYQHHLPALY